MKNLKFVDSENNSKALYFANFIIYKNDGKNKMAEFRKAAASLLKKYDIEELFSIDVHEKEAITGSNTMEKPDEIMFRTVKNVAQFNAFLNDAEYQKLKPLQEEAVRKMTYVVGTHIPYREMSSESLLSERMYAFGMIYYKPDGRKKIKEFNDKAVPLFIKHSFYADKFVHVLDKGALVGTADDFALPDEFRIFWADSPDNLDAYNNDPLYHELKGIREEGVADYPTFLGRYKEL